jgi:hypothetical protein
MEEPFPLKVWEVFRENIWPGYKFDSWSADSSYSKTKFQILEFSEDSFTVHSPPAQNFQIITKHDFFEIALLWNDYKHEKIQLNELLDLTKYFVYIISILRWLDDEGHLK